MIVEVPASGDDAREPQRSLFSWAEFMAGEPDEPPREHRDEAPTLSCSSGRSNGSRKGRSRSGPLDGTRGHRHCGGVAGSRPCMGPFVVSADDPGLGEQGVCVHDASDGKVYTYNMPDADGRAPDLRVPERGGHRQLRFRSDCI